MKITEVTEGKFGHTVLPPNRILQQNSVQIKELLQQIAKANNVTVEDAAYALTNVFKSLIGGTKP